MLRRVVPASLLALACLSPALLAQEEEVLGKKRSEWLALLKTSKEIKLRRAAVIVMEVIGPRGKGVLPGLVEALQNDPESELRREIALTLGRMGEEAKSTVPALGEVLRKDKIEGVREAAAHALGKFGPDASSQVMVLAEALSDGGAKVRDAAAVSLAALGEKAEPALPRILAAATDGKADRLVRQRCLELAARLSTPEGAGAKALVAVLDDPTAPVPLRKTAVEGIARLIAPVGLPSLKRSLKGKEADLRLAAVVALGKFDLEVQERAWGEIKPLLQDAEANIRYQAIRRAGAVAEKKGDAVPGLILAAEKDLNLENRLAAIQELGNLGKIAADAAKALQGLAVNDPRANIREAAAEAAKKVQGS